MSEDISSFSSSLDYRLRLVQCLELGRIDVSCLLASLEAKDRPGMQDAVTAMLRYGEIFMPVPGVVERLR